MEANEGKWRNGVTSIGVTKHTQINMACSHPKTPILGVRTPLKSINNLLGQTEQTQLVSKVPPMRIKAESIQRKRPFEGQETTQKKARHIMNTRLYKGSEVRCTSSCDSLLLVWRAIKELIGWNLLRNRLLLLENQYTDTKDSSSRQAHNAFYSLCIVDAYRLESISILWAYASITEVKQELCLLHNARLLVNHIDDMIGLCDQEKTKNDQKQKTRLVCLRVIKHQLMESMDFFSCTCSGKIENRMCDMYDECFDREDIYDSEHD